MYDSELITSDVQRTMKHPENIYVPIILHDIGNPVVPVKENTDMAVRGKISLAHLREGDKVLRPVVDALDGARCGLWIIGGDVLEDVLEPTLGFRSPRYFCHERMRRPISSFEITRFASESARPRSTMT